MDNIVYATYRLFMYNSTDLILQNIDDNDFYVKLTKTDYTKESHENLYSPNVNKVSGSWYSKPEFPNSKYTLKKNIFVSY